MFLAFALPLAFIALLSNGQPVSGQATQAAPSNSFISAATEQCERQTEAFFVDPQVAVAAKKGEKAAKREFDSKVAECMKPYLAKFEKFESRVTPVSPAQMSKK